MVAALKFFLGQDQAAEDDSDGDDDDEFKAVQPSKAEVYKANSKVSAVATQHMFSFADRNLMEWCALTSVASRALHLK